MTALMGILLSSTGTHAASVAPLGAKGRSVSGDSP